MTDFLRELSDELGVALPRTEYDVAARRIDAVFDVNTEDVTLPLLTLKLVRTLLPLFPVNLPISSIEEQRLVAALQPFVEDLMV